MLDPRVLIEVHINPEARVKVTRGPAPAVLQQGGYTAVLLKIVNESRGTPRLRIGSPQSGRIAPGECADARRAYDEAREIYRAMAAESPSQR